MELRKLLNLFTEQTVPSQLVSRQGATGAKLAQTSGGQFMNRADRTNQAKVDAALGPGFKAGSAAANLALAKKFSQPAMATAPVTTGAESPSASNERAKRDLAMAKNTTEPDTRAATAMASSSIPAKDSLSPGETLVDMPSPNTQAAAAMASRSAATTTPTTEPAAQTTPDNASTVSTPSRPGNYGRFSEEELEEEELEEEELEEAFDNMLRLSGLPLNERTLAQRQGVVGAKLAKTSSGQFMNRKDRLDQTKVDAALGPGFVAGRADTNLALAKKFSQTDPTLPGDQDQPSFTGMQGRGPDSFTGMQGSGPDSFTGMQGRGPDSFTGMQGEPDMKFLPPEDDADTGNSNYSGRVQKTNTQGIDTNIGISLPKIKNQPVSKEKTSDELAEMRRLSGLTLNEKAVSKQQQKFMGMVHAMQKGEKVKGASPELKKVARTMGKKDAKDFASTKHKGLPQKVSEGLNLMLDEEGHTLNHIVNKYKHEVKKFLDGDMMAENLYDALYDYYLDRGDMPYGVAKAREGDPYQWVADRFYSEIGGNGINEAPVYEITADHTLNELARLAGLSESRVDECGDMGMDNEDSFTVTTNMSSDGTKSVNIGAQGEKAEELLAMLKLAGMASRQNTMMSDEEMMDEDYANSPDEEYQSVDSIIHQGTDLNREKQQYADKPKLGDNPMAESIIDSELEAMLESILLRDEKEMKPDPDGRVRVTYPPPSKDKAPDQSELPLPNEPFHGPRSLKTEPEKTGFEKQKDVDEGLDDIKKGVTDFVGDMFNTDASIRRRSQQFQDLEKMQQKYQPGTPEYDQLEMRKGMQKERYYADKGEVVDKAGEPIKVLPPEQWKGSK